MTTAVVLELLLLGAVSWAAGTLLGRLIRGDLDVPRVPVLTPAWEGIQAVIGPPMRLAFAVLRRSRLMP